MKYNQIITSLILSITTSAINGFVLHNNNPTCVVISSIHNGNGTVRKSCSFQRKYTATTNNNMELHVNAHGTGTNEKMDDELLKLDLSMLYQNSILMPFATISLSLLLLLSSAAPAIASETLGMNALKLSSLSLPSSLPALPASSITSMYNSLESVSSSNMMISVEDDNTAVTAVIAKDAAQASIPVGEETPFVVPVGGGDTNIAKEGGKWFFIAYVLFSFAAGGVEMTNRFKKWLENRE